ncbi:MAG: ChaN family lipoprotein [Gallionella sp.]|nr:ChaN family lipoprotein [Gallionella sp.]
MRLVAIYCGLVLTMLFGHAHADTEPQALLFADHPLVGKLWDMHSQSFIDETVLLSRIKAANILLLGEVHDNRLHQEYQLKLLKAQLDSGSRPSLMMEQFDSENQASLDASLSNTNRDDAFSRAADLIKFGDWKLYAPLLSAAVDYKLPIIAANIANLQLQPVMRQGFDAYDPADLKRIKINEVWSEDRDNYLSQHIEGTHCGQISPQWRAGLVRGQRLRDALMVDAAVPSFGRGIVAIVGRNHARRDIGLPLYFSVRRPSTRMLSIGLVEVIPGMDAPQLYATETATGEAPYDVIWFSPRLDRSGRFDPCAGMRKG